MWREMQGGAPAYEAGMPDLEVRGGSREPPHIVNS